MTAHPIRLSARREGGFTVVRALIAHPMDNGFPRSATLHFITEIVLSLGGKIVARCQPGPGMSADPSFAWRIREGQPGQSVELVWQDNLGLQGSRVVSIE